MYAFQFVIRVIRVVVGIMMEFGYWSTETGLLLQFPLLYFLFLLPDTHIEHLCIHFHSPLFHQTQYLRCILLPLDTCFTYMQPFSLTLVLLCTQPHLSSYINYTSSRVNLSLLFVLYLTLNNILLPSYSLSILKTSLNLDCQRWWACLTSTSEIALIALVYSSFEVIQAPAIIIILVRPLLWQCDHLFETKNYQSMLNQHFAVTTRMVLWFRTIIR